MIRPLRLAVPCLALTALLSACDDKDDNTGVVGGSTANVRFINAVSGLSGNAALAVNGSVTGSAMSFGTAPTTCSAVNVGSGATSFAFGLPATGGTTLQSSLGTASSTLIAGGNYYVIASGSSTSPTLQVIPAISTTAPTSGNASLRVINLTGNSTAFDVFATSTATLTGATPITTNLATGAGTTTFFNVAPANSTITFTNTGSTTAALTTTLPSGTLTAGGTTTILLLRNATNTGFQAVTLSGACV
jgi:hypothetical protein